MKHQRGVSLSGLLIWCIIIAVVAMLGMKVAPDLIEYYKIRKDVAATAANARDKTVAEIRTSFTRYADVDQIQSINATDLDISKEGNNVVIAFSYEKRIPLLPNVSLLIDFQGSSGRD